MIFATPSDSVYGVHVALLLEHIIASIPIRNSRAILEIDLELTPSSMTSKRQSLTARKRLSGLTERITCTLPKRLRKNF